MSTSEDARLFCGHLERRRARIDQSEPAIAYESEIGAAGDGQLVREEWTECHRIRCESVRALQAELCRSLAADRTNPSVRHRLSAGGPGGLAIILASPAPKPSRRSDVYYC